MHKILMLLSLGLFISALQAAVGLTTVPNRDVVRMTIYNAVDLTLVQESRTLILKKGLNRIQYQWAGTLIDTTSLELRSLKNAADTDILGVIYPPNSPATLIWEVESRIEGPAVFEISYFTSGISWSADYVVRASPDERHADLEGWVGVINNSGEDYPKADVRLVVGSINLIEQIRDLASGQLIQRKTELDKEAIVRFGRVEKMLEKSDGDARELTTNWYALGGAAHGGKKPDVVSARLGDYHIFTISGVQNISNGTTARFQAITNTKPLPIEVLYRVPFMENNASKLYRFINDKAHELPKGPLPDGQWHIFHVTDEQNKTLSYSATTQHVYVPPDQKVELQLGVDPGIMVSQEHLTHAETQHHFNKEGSVDAWNIHNSYSFNLVNTKSIPISVEFLVQTDGDWTITNLTGERRDQSTYRHQAQVEAGTTLALGPFTVSVRTSNIVAEPKLPKINPLPTIKVSP